MDLPEAKIVYLTESIVSNSFHAITVVVIILSQVGDMASFFGEFTAH
jgi:hypothetical protein